MKKIIKDLSIAKFKIVLILFFVLGLSFLVVESQYKEARLQYYDDYYGERAMHAAIRIESTLDKDLFLGYVNSLTPDAKYFKKYSAFSFYQKLLQAEYVYAMAPYQGTVFQYIYDSSDKFVLTNPERLDDVSVWNPPSVLEAIRSGKPVHNSIYENIKYGEMVTGHAPIIYNGVIIGTVGVDFSGKKVRQSIEEDWMRIKWYFLAIMSFGIVVGFCTVGTYNFIYLNNKIKEYEFIR